MWTMTVMSNTAKKGKWTLCQSAKSRSSSAAMTITAGNDGMCSQQSEIRELVIEGRLVEIDYVDITTLMFSMAAGAFVSLGNWQVAVKAQE